MSQGYMYARDGSDISLHASCNVCAQELAEGTKQKAALAVQQRAAIILEITQALQQTATAPVSM